MMQTSREARGGEPGSPLSAKAWLGVVLVALAVSLPGVVHGFTGDDLVIVKRNPSLEKLSDLPRHFTANYWGEASDAGLYRPLTLVSFSLNRALTGKAPWGFHGVNALLHAIASAGVALLAARIARDRRVGLLAGLLFACHPVQTDAVQSVVGRAELLAANFTLLSVALYLKGRAEEGRSRASGFFVAAGVSYLLALLSKETPVALPGVFVLGELGSRGPGRVSRAVSRGVPFAAALGSYLLVRGWVLGGLVVPESHTYFALAQALPSDRLLTATGVLGRIALLLIFPVRLSADYSIGSIPLVTAPENPWFLAGLSVLLAVGMLAWIGRRRRGAVLGILFGVMIFVPVSNFLVPIGVVMAERLLYLPFAGVAFGAAVLGLGVHDAVRRKSFKRTLTVVFAMGLVVFTVRSIVRVRDWRDNESINRATLAVYPENSFARYNLGVITYLEGNREVSREHFARALRVRPSYPRARLYWAHLLVDEGREDEAIATLIALCAPGGSPEKSLAPVLARAHLLLAELYRSKGAFGAATREAERAVELDASLSAEKEAASR